MFKIYLTNSLNNKKEEFIPIDPLNVRMYVCGPTVYDRPHLGNARSAVIYDILFRLLQKIFSKVTYVRNITDVDDKIINAVFKSDEPINDLTMQMTRFYHEDINALNCLPPTHEPRATNYIPHMIAMIEQMILQGHAYVTENHVLFSVENFKDYGKLSNRTREEMIAGARVEIAPFKRDAADFVLWKPSIDAEYKYGFDSPWGRGRPGWHIECSAMSRELLGEVFDIHGGGADLMFPHHENEIAQSTCTSKNHDFVRYWVHNGFLTVEGEKMSKSLGNFKTVRELLDENIEGIVIRYLYLSTHYRKPLDFTKKALKDARKSILRFREAVKIVANTPLEDIKEFIEILTDDLNTPALLAKLHEYASLALKGDTNYAALVKAGCDLIGLNLKFKELEIPIEITKLAKERLIAKNNKDWQKADELRARITEKGYYINDINNGFEIIKN